MRRLRRRYGRSSRSMTFGVMPPYAEFAARVGSSYPIEAHANSEDARALKHAGAKPTGHGDYGKLKWVMTPKKLYGVVKRLADGDEEGMSIASSIMSTLDYEWI